MGSFALRSPRLALDRCRNTEREREVAGNLRECQKEEVWVSFGSHDKERVRGGYIEPKGMQQKRVQ